MAVYVDALIIWGGDDAPKCFQHKHSCHMYADTLDELHIMAKKIGLKQSWFQNHKFLPHYDLVTTKRILAVKYGAIEQDRKEAVETWKRIRQ